MADYIIENLIRVRATIAAAAEKSGRRPEDIRLVAVTKTVPPEKINQAVAAGVTDLGENYLQEALAKQPLVTGPVNWHFIGHLQRNKAEKALQSFSLIQSVDSLRLAQELDRRAKQLGREVEILLQVNTSGEESKSGVAPEQAEELVETIAGLGSLKLQGLMTIGRLEPDPEAARGEFRSLAELFRRLGERDLPRVTMRWLSMGMSHDFEAAILEGANLVRIGRGIFGPRP
jgi:pyridoxal phosphate enzyme (YggS family)